MEHPPQGTESKTSSDLLRVHCPSRGWRARGWGGGKHYNETIIKSNKIATESASPGQEVLLVPVNTDLVPSILGQIPFRSKSKGRRARRRLSPEKTLLEHWCLAPSPQNRGGRHLCGHLTAKPAACIFSQHPAAPRCCAWAALAR